MNHMSNQTRACQYLRLRLLVFLMLFGSGCCTADVSGERAKTSDDIIRISLEILPSIKIDAVGTINLQILNRDVDTSFTSALCVSGNVGGKYRITAFGDATNSNRFELSNDEGNRLIYFVAYRGTPDHDFDDLNPGEASPVYDLQAADSCDDNQSFKITFRASDLSLVESGLYTGHLTLLVSPV